MRIKNKTNKSRRVLRLFFMNPVSYGGHVTYTVHLMRGLRKQGIDVFLYKVGNNTEGHSRPYGYGEEYRNLCIEDAVKMAKKDPCLITAPSKPQAQNIQTMLDAGARIVIHDPAEFKHGWDWQSVERPILIRKSMLQYFKKGVFILHPYDPYFKEYTKPTGEWSAVSTSRIDFDKHTELLLDANRLIKKKSRKIQIYGFENRIYTRFNILPNYPEWVQSVAKYPKELRYAVKELCHKAVFMLDMSVIKGDGGGTQYTFLEAIDAGCCCVLNSEWIIQGHCMKPDVNCLSAGDGKSLARMIKEYYASRAFRAQVYRISVQARKMLKRHDASDIAEEYIDELL